MTGAAAAACCTRETHDELRSDPARWHRETIPIGVYEDEEARLVMANCRICGSTLAIEVGL